MVKNLLIGLLVGGALVSCRQFENPIVEAPNYARFDYRAQSKTFKVITSQGKPYNHKVDYHIIGLSNDDQRDYLTEAVDTLTNGDIRISYDWISFTLTENKTRIVVEVKQNDTDKEREANLATFSSHGGSSPRIYITQLPKGAQ